LWTFSFYFLVTFFSAAKLVENVDRAVSMALVDMTLHLYKNSLKKKNV